jgi:hypothetical protein
VLIILLTLTVIRIPMLHGLSELMIVVWIVAAVGSVLFLITDHSCKECRLLDLRKLAYIERYISKHVS